jgi:nucleoside-diphosphate-sugar epimerase
MRIFITGGTGFLGQALCTFLQGHDVLVLTRDPAKTQLPSVCRPLTGDLWNCSSWEQKMRAFRPQVCVHLGWTGLPDHSLAISAKNFQAGLDLFRCLLETQCTRILVTGSCAEYGNLKGCLTEDRVPSAQGIFAKFKTSQRLVGESLFAPRGISFLWARPFFVYGPGQRAAALIPSVFQSLRAGKSLNVRTPNARHDFIHVEDVARGLVALITTECPPGVYNLGSGQITRVRDLINLMARQLKRPEVYLSPDLVDIESARATTPYGDGFWADIERMQRLTGWRALLSLEEGIRKTVAIMNAKVS